MQTALRPALGALHSLVSSTPVRESADATTPLAYGVELSFNIFVCTRCPARNLWHGERAPGPVTRFALIPQFAMSVPVLLSQICIGFRKIISVRTLACIWCYHIYVKKSIAIKFVIICRF